MKKLFYPERTVVRVPLILPSPVVAVADLSPARHMRPLRLRLTDSAILSAANAGLSYSYFREAIWRPSLPIRSDITRVPFWPVCYNPYVTISPLRYGYVGMWQRGPWTL